MYREAQVPGEKVLGMRWGSSITAKVVLETLGFQNCIRFSQRAMGQKNEDREEYSLALWKFFRFRKETLVFLWCSDLLPGDLFKLLEEGPGNSGDGEIHWGQRSVGTHP